MGLGFNGFSPQVLGLRDNFRKDSLPTQSLMDMPSFVFKLLFF